MGLTGRRLPRSPVDILGETILRHGFQGAGSRGVTLPRWTSTSHRSRRIAIAWIRRRTAAFAILLMAKADFGVTACDRHQNHHPTIPVDEDADIIGPGKIIVKSAK